MTGRLRVERPGSAERTVGESTELAEADGWSVEIRRDDGALESLRSDWEALYARCPAATPFQSWGWLVAWWRSYGVPGRLRLVLVRRSGELVAALPLMLRRRYGHRVLAPVGGEISDYADMLADDGWADQALPLVAEALLRPGGWAAVDLTEVRPAAFMWRLADLWPNVHDRFPSSICMQASFHSTDQYLAGLPKNRRKKMRHGRNKADALGLSVREVPPGEAGIEATVATMVRLHERQWQGRNITPEHLRPRFAAHLTAALSVMVPAGQAAVTEYVLGEDIVGVFVTMLGHDMVGGYLYGIEPEARAEVDFMPLLVLRLMELAERSELTIISLLRGAESNKEYWQLQGMPNERLVLGGAHRLPATSYLTIIRCRTALAALVKAHLPRIQPLVDRLRQGVSRSLPGERKGGEVAR